MYIVLVNSMDTPSILGRVSIDVTKHHDQKLWQVTEKRIFLAYTSISLFTLKEIRTETQTREEPGEGAGEALEGCCILACSTGLAQPAFL